MTWLSWPCRAAPGLVWRTNSAKLSGEAIPLCGRIVALADVYDALTSRRVYKSAFTHDVARQMIVSESDTHFDPDVVDAFVHSETDFLATRDYFAESLSQAA